MGRRDRIVPFFRAAIVSLIVQKYGGTSMGSPDRIREVARRVARFAAEGHKLVIVPSAMAGETNRLLGLAKDLNPDADPRELDVIASTGEQVSIGLLAIALQRLGLKARSYTGWQVPILTDAAFSKARRLVIGGTDLTPIVQWTTERLPTRHRLLEGGQVFRRDGLRHPVRARSSDRLPGRNG